MKRRKKRIKRRKGMMERSEFGMEKKNCLLRREIRDATSVGNSTT